MTDFRAEVIDSADFKLVAASQAQIFASHSFIERYSLNATDAIVLRSALDIAIIYRQIADDLVLLASDRRLVTAAQREGLKTFNPETDSQYSLILFSLKLLSQTLVKREFDVTNTFSF